MNITRFIICFLLAAIIWAGCATKKPTPDPLASWTFRGFDDFLPSLQRHHYQLDKAITDDYKDFIAKNKLFLGGAITGFYEDGIGQHAVEFEGFPPDENATWNYVLIYNKENQRIKVIKYGYKRYQS